MHWGNVLTWIKARPLSNWVAAIAVIVIVIGSFFGLWQIEWRQFLATYIPISRPPPEIVALAPDHGPQGTEVSLSGRRLDGFGIRESYVKIGPFEVARARLSPHEDAILFTVASQSSPGRYAIELVIDGKRAKEEKSFKVTLLNDDQLEAVRIGQKRIILVAPFGSKEEGNEEEGRRKQDDIVEQIERSFGSTPVLRDTIIVAKWPQEISGLDKDNFALQLVKENNAELLVYGTLTDENISARVAVANAVHLDRPVEIIPVVSKHTLDKDIPALGAQTQRNFDLSPEPVTRPVKLMYFLQGWHFMADSKFAAARDAFLEVSKFPNLDVVDLASFRYAAGRASLFAASDIGEQPQRTPYDYQQMDVYLAEAKESLLAAEQAYAKQHKLKEQGETLIELALLSTLERQESPAEQHMESARFLERAVSNLNCENDQDDCFRAYTNLAADYDWMGTEAWSRSNHDDLLLKAEKSNSAAASLIGGQDAAFKRIFNQYDRAVILAQLYAGDRDANLAEAIDLGSKAVTEFERELDRRRGTIVLALNMIGRAYLDLAIGDRPENLRRAEEALQQGVKTNQSPSEYPEYRDMLNDGLLLVEKSRRHGGELREWEVHQRAQAAIDKLIQEGRGNDAADRAWEMIRFSWSRTRYGELSPHLADYHYFIGKALMLATDYREAINHFRMSLAVNALTQSKEPWFAGFDDIVSKSLRNGLLATGASESGIEQYTAAARAGFFEAKKVFEPIGDQLATSPADLRKADAWYTEALRRLPFDADLIVKRATAAAQSGDADNALRDFDDALRVYAGNPDALWNRAIAYMQARRWNEALDDLEQVSKSADRGRRPAELRILLAQTKCFEELGQIDTAVAQLNKALAASGDTDLRTKIKSELTRLQALQQ